MGRLRTWLRARMENRRLVIAVELIALAILLGALGWAFRGVWADAAPRLRHADPVEIGLSLLVLAAYYLFFVVGWVWILAAYGIRLPYRIALQAEMLSMLAKYVPGGVWTPAARVVALRRLGIGETPVILATVLLEAGLSALAGVGVFVVGLAFVDGADAPLLPLIAFGLLLVVLLYPPVFRVLASKLLKPFGAEAVEALSPRTALKLLAFYACTWPLGGLALFFLLRSVGGDPPLSSIPFLGGASAVGAIVAVLVIFAPSGLGVREASVYGLLLAVAVEGVALGAIVLNRLAITVVEAALLLVGILLVRSRPRLPEDVGTVGVARAESG
ncbi:MAG TPA: lysylphosphatidylglycerol synthase domain-containing protein [Gaiellaceae bacterium]|nr:lysylphosphatidylglycerol synthase domain-containing protein [Gaiellaceae bacterium]